MKWKFKRIMGILLSLTLLLGEIPGMSIMAYAGTDTYTTLKNNATVVKFNDYNWYIIEDNSTSATEGTVTLLAADDKFGTSAFSDSMSNAYSSSKIRDALDAYTTTGAFKDVASAIETVKVKGSDSDTEVDAKLYLLDTATAQSLNSTILNYNFPNSEMMGGWWLRSAGNNAYIAACVFGEYGYVLDRGNIVL